MGRVDHLVGLLCGPVGRLEQRPDVVVQVLAEPPMVGGVEIMGGQVVAHDGFGHDWFLSLAELADDVVDALEAVDARLDARTLLTEESLPLGGVVGGEHGPDRFERYLEVAQAADRAGRLQLVAAVAPVAGESIDLGRREQAGLVVVAQRADAQPAEPREPADREEVVHARIVDPRVTRESRTGALRDYSASSIFHSHAGRGAQTASRADGRACS
jgi:hypothetical protein